MDVLGHRHGDTPINQSPIPPDPNNMATLPPRRAVCCCTISSAQCWISSSAQLSHTKSATLNLSWLPQREEFIECGDTDLDVEPVSVKAESGIVAFIGGATERVFDQDDPVAEVHRRHNRRQDADIRFAS